MRLDFNTHTLGFLQYCRQEKRKQCLRAGFKREGWEVPPFVQQTEKVIQGWCVAIITSLCCLLSTPTDILYYNYAIRLQDHHQS